MNKQPEVTAKTRQSFIDAFLELYKEKSIEKISINEITRIAGKNRSTFYNYFKDVYDLLEQIENELVENIFSDIEKKRKEMGIDISVTPTFEEIYQVLSPAFLKYEEKLYALIGPDGDPHFADHLRSRFSKSLDILPFLPKDTPHKDYIATHVYTSIISMLTHWHQNGKDLSEKEFIQLVQKLTAFGVIGYISDLEN